MDIHKTDVLKDTLLHRDMIWNGYLNEMRHDAIARQKQTEPTDAEIQLLGRMIYFLTSFAKSAQTDGLLAVEEAASGLDLENRTEAFLYKAVEMLTDGCSPEYIAEVLSNYYWISRPEGFEATAVYIGIRGVLLVLDGMHSYGVKQIVSSMLPVKIREKCSEVCRGYEVQEQKKKDEIAKVYFETDFSRCDGLEVRVALDWLERQLSCMSDREIQRLLREVDNSYLVQALIGMKQDARQAITRNMSARLRALIMGDCYQLASIDDGAIVKGAEHVTEKLKVLQESGEIN